uniref:Uncharacterized protein n=1 Tax=Megaselia scalaris TaxID=36166 RepID=T1H007_MEGSC
MACVTDNMDYLASVCLKMNYEMQEISEFIDVGRRIRHLFAIPFFRHLFANPNAQQNVVVLKLDSAALNSSARMSYVPSSHLL